MKKTFLFVFALASVFLSSCLDDGESTFSGSNEFSVLRESDLAGKYLLTANGFFITGDDIKAYNQGDAFFLSSYKVNTKNVVGSTDIIRADYINIGVKYPNDVQKLVSYQVADTEINITDQIGVRSLTRIASDANEAFLNRALLEYVIDHKDGEVFDLTFYYDETKQVDRTGAQLPNSTAVLDIVFTKSGEGIGNATTTSKRFVLNATNLRAKLRPSSFEGNYFTKDIDFRYSKYNTSTNKYEQVYAQKVLGFIYYPSK